MTPPQPPPPPVFLVNSINSLKTQKKSRLSSSESNEKDMIKEYDDDAAFAKLAQNKKKHDAVALANILYGSSCSPRSIEQEPRNQSKKTQQVHFAQDVGRLTIDASLLDNIDGNTGDKEKDSLIEYVALSKEYVMNPVKNQFDFVSLVGKGEQSKFGAMTDVILFDRRQSSEYDEKIGEKRNKMRENGISTNLSNIMTKDNMKEIKEQQRLSQEEEIRSLLSSNKNGQMSKVALMKAIIAENKQQTVAE